MDKTFDLVNTIVSGANEEATKHFNSIMSSKISDALTSKKLEIASAIYKKED